MNMKVRKILTLIFDFANYSFIIPAVSRIMVVLITTQFDAVYVAVHFHFTNYCEVTMTQRNFDSTFTKPVPGVGLDTVSVLAVRRG
jgi:hypothetical protein